MRVASLRSEKARLWLQGRSGWKNRLPEPTDRPKYWFHCASLGEFEQARPLMEQYADSGITIYLSFFSPSGYEQRKNWEKASWVGYLPLDTAANARYWYDHLKPDKVIIVKYEFWYHYLTEAAKRNIPLYLIGARFRSSQPFFKWYGSLHRRMLLAFTQFFTQDEQSVELLKSLGIHNAEKSGDPRFDRVLGLREQRKEYPLVGDFCGDHFSLVAGSCWPPEEELVHDVMDDFPEYRWILVPHDVSEGHLQSVEARFGASCIRYSRLEGGEPAGDCSVLLIDRIGMLGSLYPYAQVALVGGGFRNALHNILEAAVWGVPVLYGNRIPKFPEGTDLEEAGGGYTLEDARDFRNKLGVLNREEAARMGKCAADWISRNAGATARIIDRIG